MKNTLILLIMFSLSLFAGDWQTFNTSNSGLAGNRVRSILVDAQGNKWFGTDQGLSAFDGVKWVTYTTDNQQQTLADNSINDMALEETGTGPELWIATDNGVSVMAIPAIDAVTKATPYRSDNTGLIDNKVTAAAVDPLRHEHWFGTPQGASRFSTSGWNSFSMSTSPMLAWNDVTSIGIDPTGGWKYIGTQNGIADMNGVSRLHTSANDVDAISAPSPYNKEWSGLYSRDILTVFVDTDGTQWYGTKEGFAFHDTTETKAGWDQFTIEEGLINDTVQAITKGSDQVVWVGTPGGLSRFEYQFGEYGIETWKFTNYTAADGLADNNILDLALDADGTLWIGTANGVSHFTGVTAVAARKTESQPKVFGLVKNYPNPFNPTTTIVYVLPSAGHVDLSIYSIDGRNVRGLVSMNQSVGQHSAVWDGRLADGQAPTGIYTARLRFDGTDAPITDCIKMLLVK
jgi:ligand-binding sensor domain-containing protein